MSLSLVRGTSYVCPGVFAVGVYVHGNTAILIDSGSDESSAKNITHLVQSAGCTITAIIQTHAHADHCGGTSFLQKKFPQVRVYATYDEKCLIEDPLFAPRCFCGGAAPFLGLQNKSIAPQRASAVTDVITPYQDQRVDVCGVPFTLVTLPGHSSGAIGVITPDNVLYCGDAIVGPVTFNKHPFLFYTNIGDALSSFKKLANKAVDACVIYHGGLDSDHAATLQQHEARILETRAAILSIVKDQGASIDSITQSVMKMYAIPNNMVAWTLTQTTVKAYLAQLEAEKNIELVVTDGLLVVRAVSFPKQ
ncbi:MAG: Zn-dependent hydrolase, glyoxylase [candidate division TM6 bacterium GW2011_GWE2_41_16]|nr:MAG: Zn-dependent hydrolase, glyoxylase [candidate division TM6 bacterium GW2011_GWE2_41_16]